MIVEYIIKNWLAITALFLSGASFIHTFIVARRDNAKLITSGGVFSMGEHGSPGIRVKGVNIGRRPIILTQIQFLYDDGSRRGSALGHPNGLTLKEQEFVNEKFDVGDETLYRNEEGVGAVDFWFIDSQGKKHRIKNSKEYLKKLWEINKTMV